MKGPKLNNLKWWGVDFDGVVCRSKYNPVTDKWDMLGVMPDTRKVLTKIQKSGKKVVIITSRASQEYIEIEEFMNENKLPFDRIVTGKELVEFMIDDRAIHFESWEQVEKELWKD
jgi:hydroxymethylpyrimidine pyrophosphatase-like HAD family hydrolase